MKQVLLALCLIGLIVGGAQAQVEFVPALGYGAFYGKGISPQTGKQIGFEVPIYQDASHGLKVKNQTTYLKSSSTILEPSGGDQVEVAKTAIILQKSLHTATKWGLYCGSGSSLWDFVNSEGKDRQEISHRLELGAWWWMFDLSVGVDFLTLDGDDYYFVNGLLNVDFWK